MCAKRGGRGIIVRVEKMFSLNDGLDRKSHSMSVKTKSVPLVVELLHLEVPIFSSRKEQSKTISNF